MSRRDCHPNHKPVMHSTCCRLCHALDVQPKECSAWGKLSPHCLPWLVLPFQSFGAPCTQHCYPRLPNHYPTELCPPRHSCCCQSCHHALSSIKPLGKRTLLPNTPETHQHPLPSSFRGAMALKLQGIDDSLIMKIGRWTGLTFLTYIHSQQIGALNTGLATKMAKRVHFINVAG
jgi:hypothetical protein